MEKTQINIEKGQYLKDILQEIPTNTILAKTVPGCGATTLEIESQRNSIIIVPNIPVIHSKCEKHGYLFGVFEGVSVQDITLYLKGGQLYKKIMTTPESFQKVKMAFEECGIDMFSDYFCLMDECHKLVKDVDYRSDIVLPMIDFFEFKGKALVSATPLELSDPKFEKQEFQTLEIVPTYDYWHDIFILHVNDVYTELEGLLKVMKSSTFFFINSIDLISSIIQQAEIEKESAVFCSPKSRVKMVGEYNFNNVYTKWSPKYAKKFNFFTERFYNAFDLEWEEKPDVYIITDVFKAEYTMVDIFTDCIQIVGRFRNGVGDVYHFFNTNTDIESITKEQAEKEIFAHQKAYEIIKTYYNNANSIEERRAFGEALQSLPFNKMLFPSGAINYFARDNWVNEKLVRSYYNDGRKIYSAYFSCPNFHPYYNYDYYPLTDVMKLKMLKSSMSVKKKREIYADILKSLPKPYSEYDYNTITEIRKIDPLIVEAFEKLGVEKIEELKFSEKKMKEALILASRKSNKTIQMVKNSFKTGYKYSNEAIVKELTRIYAELGIHPDKIIKGSMILDYFNASPIKVKGDRGYYLIDEKV